MTGQFAVGLLGPCPGDDNQPLVLGGPIRLRAHRSSANLRRLCGHSTYVASVAVLQEIPQDRPDDGHITSCSLALLRSSENILTVLDRCAVAEAPPANTPDHDRIGQRPPAFPGNRGCS